ncbi:ATP-binding protein [Pedobacter sp. MR2016-19]|uniref:AAA family ATPase n=1 Tax=Pedobacter sp. MR2016-19 TaxID=2780089 RepID=UPI0018748DEA|nr:AAA family ATPase [Pedobacter sp. MR2016-19]MBE5320844.1 ATP-binding protein [Pedobacter sp. MR2016-19]
MKYLRLDNNDNEFLVNGEPIFFLNDVKELNITIGPNNSRKSRFLRSLINQDYKVVFESDAGFNEAFLVSKTIFDQLDQKYRESGYSLLQLQVLAGNSDTNRILAKFLNDRSGSDTSISFADLQEGIERINDSLMTCKSENDIKTLRAVCTPYYTLVLLLQNIYGRINGDDGMVSRPGSYSASGIEQVTYLIRDGDYGLVVDYEQKLEVINSIEQYIRRIKALEFVDASDGNIYIPVLRTSRMLEGMTEDVFEKTLRIQHFTGKAEKLSLETGLSLYEKIGFVTNGTQQQKREFREFERFLGNVFFQSDDLHITAYRERGSDAKHIKVSIPGEMEDRDIHNLGDGIQAIINLLFPVFTGKDNSWIFIDEPENHLHPGFQTIFMRALSENEFIKTKKHTIFINTHSNHILSEALLALKETEIMVFNRVDKSASNILSFTGNEYSTLEMLGVLNASVLISNCSVWVEGVTDRLYLKALLHVYLRSLGSGYRPVEGLNYTFMEYAGVNHLHYDFDAKSVGDEGIKEKIDAFLINTNIFFLADTDGKEDKHEAYRAIERGNFMFRETGVPEIENLLPEKIIRDFLTEELKFPVDEIKAITPLQSSDQKLGAYLSEQLKGVSRHLKLEAEYGGTLTGRYKKKLADFVYRKLVSGSYGMDEVSESPELEKLVIDLYGFIRLKNGK